MAMTQFMVEEEKAQRRWTEYFEQLLNVDERREAEILKWGGERVPDSTDVRVKDIRGTFKGMIVESRQM